MIESAVIKTKETLDEVFESWCIEDKEDIINQIATSFNISFVPNELLYVETFGQLCDHVLSKINQKETDDCTSQQAFYKLREAIVSSKHIDESFINLDMELATIFPRKNRRKSIDILEQALGFKLNILEPKNFISIMLVILFSSSLIAIFFNWKYSLIGIVSSILLGMVVNKTGKEFNVKTIRQLTEKMTRENYLNSRRDTSSVNRKEIVKTIEQLFLNWMLIEKDYNQIPPETIIINRKTN